jgi:hypothetical protein
MTAIRIETQLDSDTLYLPQLKPLLGKAVEIIVREKAVPIVTPGTSDWADVQAAVRDLEDYDFGAWREVHNAE